MTDLGREVGGGEFHFCAFKVIWNHMANIHVSVTTLPLRVARGIWIKIVKNLVRDFFLKKQKRNYFVSSINLKKVFHFSFEGLERRQ